MAETHSHSLYIFHALPILREFVEIACNCFDYCFISTTLLLETIKHVSAEHL